MCLRSNPEIVSQLLSGRHKVFTVYKIVYMNTVDKKLFSMYYPSFKYKAGPIISNTKRKKPSNRIINVYKGIHCYREIPNNQVFMDCYVVIKLTGKRENIIGANEEEIVFSRVSLSKAEYERIRN